MANFRTHVLENPMLIEALRMGRKFFGVSRLNKANAVFVWLAGVVYTLLILTTVAYRRDLSAQAILHIQTALFCFMVPAITYGAISAERERRSWELLMVAPVSKSQIILGKFLSSALVIIAVAALIFPILLLSFQFDRESIMSLISGEVTSIGFALSLAAIGIYFSARSNRSLTSLALVYSAMIVWLLVIPLLIVSITGGSEGTIAGLMWMHPFVAIAEQFGSHVFSHSYVASQVMYLALPQLILYNAISIGCLTCSIKAIGKSDPVLGRG
jgi:ABC-type transport system involved in multi-copper enzyme maturation permease subunit